MPADRAFVERRRGGRRRPAVVPSHGRGAAESESEYDDEYDDDDDGADLECATTTCGGEGSAYYGNNVSFSLEDFVACDIEEVATPTMADDAGDDDDGSPRSVGASPAAAVEVAVAEKRPASGGVGGGGGGGTAPPSLLSWDDLYHYSSGGDDDGFFDSQHHRHHRHHRHHHHDSAAPHEGIGVSSEDDDGMNNHRTTTTTKRRRKIAIVAVSFGVMVAAVAAVVGVTLRRTAFRAGQAAAVVVAAEDPDAEDADDADRPDVDWTAVVSTTSMPTYYSPASPSPTYGPVSREGGEEEPGRPSSSFAWATATNGGDPASASPTAVIGPRTPSPSDVEYSMPGPAMTPAPTSPGPTSVEPTTSTVAQSAPEGGTPDATSCGNGNRGDGICPNGGDCCSGYGWCGNTARHCGITRRPTRRPTTRAAAAPQGSPQEEGGALPIEESKLNDDAAAAVPSGSRLTIELRTDEHGEETSWTLYSVDSTDGQDELIAFVRENTYNSYEEDFVELDLAPGKYRFTLKDSFGDGFCCSNGSDGMFAIRLDGRLLIRGDYYRSELSYDIAAGHDPESTMSDRDVEWLVAHNTRRRTWHQRHGETYVPLMWSAGLAKDALSWATELLDDCEIKGIAPCEE